MDHMRRKRWYRSIYDIHDRKIYGQTPLRREDKQTLQNQSRGGIGRVQVSGSSFFRRHVSQIGVLQMDMRRTLVDFDSEGRSLRAVRRLCSAPRGTDIVYRGRSGFFVETDDQIGKEKRLPEIKTQTVRPMARGYSESRGFVNGRGKRKRGSDKNGDLEPFVFDIGEIRLFVVFVSQDEEKVQENPLFHELRVESIFDDERNRRFRFDGGASFFGVVR
jgi:hypothetical protein